MGYVIVVFSINFEMSSNFDDYSDIRISLEKSREKRVAFMADVAEWLIHLISTTGSLLQKIS